MNYAEIKYCDIANGPGVRTSLFVSGCTHHCEGCFNQMTWDFHYGEVFTKEVEDQIIESLRPDYIEGLTILGGEPLEHVNQMGLLPLVKRIRDELPQKNIWCFTGYTFEADVLERMSKMWPETMELMKRIDVLVDGKFVLELKDISLQFRGSSNQRLIDMPKTLQAGVVVLWEDKNNAHS